MQGSIACSRQVTERPKPEPSLEAPSPSALGTECQGEAKGEMDSEL